MQVQGRSGTGEEMPRSGLALVRTGPCEGWPKTGLAQESKGPHEVRSR